MTCPKCNKEIPYDHNLCGYCGNPIREKCPECGEMELIGRVVCEKKLREAFQKRMQFTEKSSSLDYPFWIAFFGTLITGFGMIITARITKIHPFIIITGVFVSMLLTMALSKKVGAKQKNAEREMQQEFFHLHPDLEEKIKKEESADAKAMADKGREK